VHAKVEELNRLLAKKDVRVVAYIDRDTGEGDGQQSRPHHRRGIGLVFLC